MKKGFVISAIAALVLSQSAFAADNGDGTIRFKGEIVDAPCVVSADSQNQEVNLGQVKTTTLKDPGSKSPAKAFQIKLEECDISTKQNVQVQFDGLADDDGRLLVNNEAGAATKVAIGLFNKAGADIKVGTATAAETLKAGQNVLYYSAAYVSKEGGATPGYGNSQVDFNVTYN
ncbi:long polar fimbrial protein LpfA [Chimaeribacter californicus]|uniref:Long polar fimbrial protein LpfA n=1 Tax=Chimaeribacter californicus TaxID=2060067 RepID=A0A2N5EC34_9GAMM|nr:fimbrial protein [Chimaeribacter californicus]PLR39695.1 long polar fimbrial protein LpfA [Chimaeribacter californicus]